jgi:hypothetical protein
MNTNPHDVTCTLPMDVSLSYAASDEMEEAGEIFLSEEVRASLRKQVAASKDGEMMPAGDFLKKFSEIIREKQLAEGVLSVEEIEASHQERMLRAEEQCKRDARTRAWWAAHTLTKREDGKINLSNGELMTPAVAAAPFTPKGSAGPGL